MDEDNVIFQYMRERGEAKGREQGREEGKRESVQRILEKRFGAVPSEVKNALKAIDDSDLLDRALDIALDCPDPETLAVRLREG